MMYLTDKLPETPELKNPCLGGCGNYGKRKDGSFSCRMIGFCQSQAEYELTLKLYKSFMSALRPVDIKGLAEASWKLIREWEADGNLINLRLITKAFEQAIKEWEAKR